MHRLQNLGVAPDLHLWPCPKEAETLGVVLGEPRDVGVLLCVLLQLRLPARGLLLGDNPADDDAPRLTDGVGEGLGEVPIIGLDVGEVDLRDGLGTGLRDAVRLDL